MISKFKNQKGFTVLESIVAIFVLSLSISGVFSAVQQSLSQTIVAKDEVKAFYLAQEAMEIIRNKRDANLLAIINTGSGHWLSGIAQNSSDPCYFGNTCTVDAYYYYIGKCWGEWESCPPLRQDTDSTFLYSYNASWPDSIFTRSIQIESINEDEIAVKVRVSWTKGLLNKEFEVKAHLFNWI
jgi:type II secretory pathway pseudopilin PulG